MSGNLLRGKSLTSKQAPQMLLEAIPPSDVALTFDPESRWIYPPERDIHSSILPFDWRRNPRVEICGQLFAMDRGGSYVIKPFESKSQFVAMTSRSMSLAEAGRIHTIQPADLRPLAMTIAGNYLREADFGIDTTLPSISTKMASYVPYVAGPYDRQQYMQTLLLAKSRAYHAWNSNPFGHRIPLIIAYFVVGRGVAAMFNDQGAQQIWDRFADVNGFAMKVQGSGKPKLTGNKLTTYNVMLSVDGELLFHFTPYEDTLRVRALDAATILECVTNPWDIEEIFYYHQQFMPQWQLFANPDIPVATYTIRQIPSPEVLHVTINTFDNEKRGRSDCMSVYGWMRRVADIANANATAAYLRSCYVWDVAVDGAPIDVTRLANDLRNNPHRPGMSYVHGTGVTRQALGPSFSGSGVESDLAGLINLISLGSGIPPAYLLGSMGANRAGVLTETEPSGKFFVDRQALNEQMLHEMKYRLFKHMRDINGIRVKSDECEFIFPSINLYDRTNLLTALGIMEDRQWFAPKRCASLAAKEFQTSNYNYEQEFVEIQKALTIKSRFDTQRNVEGQEAIMALQGGMNAQGSDQVAPAGDTGGAAKDKESAGPGIRFLGAGKSSKGPNGSGGVDEGEAARTRKSLSGR